MQTKAFAADVRHRPRFTTVNLHGEIDAFAEDGLNSAYEEAERQGSEVIMLNFSDVDYINSTGIALIVGLLAQARKSHRQLQVYGLDEHYLEIFKITRLSDFMNIFPDEATALANLPAGAAPSDASA